MSTGEREPAGGRAAGFDPNAYRQASLQSWEAAAGGWQRRQELMRQFAGAVSHWLIEAISPQPGQRVLELAGGIGETGMLAAALVAPLGGVIISDQAQAMLDSARERASELGLSNVEFQVLNAEWIDLPLASVDAVLCRWGYMLMADPAAALAETRRVLRPGGRVALAVWDKLEHNPWALLPAQELIARGLATPPNPGAPSPPGPFALADTQLVRELLAQAGFLDVRVHALDLVRRQASFAELWESTLDMSPSFHDAVLSRPAGEIAEIEASLAERFAPYTSEDGTLEIPGRTLVACAEA
ncbi:MAG TPA: methyltransferase domain-containing protein [Solirubrobacteraceae bacterium]|nr:methyltransferase domain-containing protein [Solirubrobacteraceae bacterium]